MAYGFSCSGSGSSVERVEHRDDHAHDDDRQDCRDEQEDRAPHVPRRRGGGVGIGRRGKESTDERTPGPARRRGPRGSSPARSGIDALVGGGPPLSRDRKETFALRLDRYHDDLADALARDPPRPRGPRRARCSRLVELAAVGVRRATRRAAPPRRPAAAQPGLAPAAADVRLRLLHRAVRRGPARRGQAPRPPRGPGRHLPAPDAAAPAARGRQRRRVRRAGLPAPSAATSAPWTTCATWRPRCASAGSACAWTSCSTTSRVEHEWAAKARAGGADSQRTATTSTSSPTRPCRRLRADAARGVPRLRSRQLHLGRRPAGLGLDDVQRVPVGPQLGQPRGAGRVRRDHPRAGQPRRRGAAARRDRVPLEAARAPTARTSPRCTRSPRRCARSPGSRRPAVAFKAEAIVGPRDLVQYLGTGKHAGKVSDLAYHNSLMVQVWSMLAARNTVLARQALGALPATPTTGTWITYLRCHDDIGWAIDDRGRARRRASPATGTGRSSPTGTPASSPAPGPTGWSSRPTRRPATGGSAARRRRWPACASGATSGPAVDNALARIFLAHAVVAGWGGIPVVWSGDELGQVNDPDWASEPGHENDNRWAHRPRLDWSRAVARDDLRTVPGRVFTGLRHLASVRARLPQLHASAPRRSVLQDTDDGVLAVVRRHASGTFVGLYNVTEQAAPVRAAPPPRRRADRPVRRPRRPRPRGRHRWACSGCRRTPRGGWSTDVRP